ncbi:MAG: NADH-quinone oxidoreductase subunit G [Legionellaceae bacterium]|nr:NADH-quinone oxidoreductase subunit G [Legionellaceae bacterium]HAF87433.1 NADH-quinone oxidoreductase subunit G [Legionellales bacterium]HCA88817.1 NADH-quinone oxidoreductase subunit G [Legionellales bacterium]|tara:strand:+ start:1813 stop:4164 length:2352 start_codon:yes stop_codon:yes gene_type:complete
MATIEIDGKKFEVDNGKMIIEVADEAGIHIPRFCYHKKLSVAANCRMCLVEVENNRKTVPACATPITDGMKVFTQSQAAIHSQKAVMEFLLINHPLDCPICDQGGECELQDVSMGYGYATSEYEESKRTVKDQNLGTLISTDMTRCIHCTRCVRFGDEIAGLRELGASFRGEKMKIGTYVEQSMVSEVSGNIIDLCPVGALTSKPARYTYRPWELKQYDSIAPHDCIGSNIHTHTRQSKLVRVIPRENEALNETWLADRDRFSYLGMNSASRIAQPKIKRNGQWETVDWPEALQFVVDNLNNLIKQYSSEQVGVFASPSSTVEELYLLQKLMRSLGITNLDHRLHQIDFSDQMYLPALNTNSCRYAEIEEHQQILLIGCNIHREVPIAGLRLVKAAQNGKKILAINPIDYDFHFDLAHKKIISPLEMPLFLLKIINALDAESALLPKELQALLDGVESDDISRAMANALCQSKALIITGEIFDNHPNASLLRTLIYHIRQITKAGLYRLSVGANATGANLLGMLPHRRAFGYSCDEPGLDIQTALTKRLKAYLLFNVEPNYDVADPYNARQAMLGAEFVVAFSAFQNDTLEDYVDVILPIAPFTETSGTYINIDNTWQTFKGVCTPYAQSRPAWKILRVLANLFNVADFDYFSTDEVLSEIKEQVNTVVEIKYIPTYPKLLPTILPGLIRVGEWPLYRIDAIVRHAAALQQSAAADTACIKLNPETARLLKLDGYATVVQGDIEITLPLKQDSRVPPEVVWVANAMPETVDLGHSFAAISIKR